MINSHLDQCNVILHCLCIVLRMKYYFRNFNQNDMICFLFFRIFFMYAEIYAVVFGQLRSVQDRIED